MGNADGKLLVVPEGEGVGCIAVSSSSVGGVLEVGEADVVTEGRDVVVGLVLGR